MAPSRKQAATAASQGSRKRQKKVQEAAPALDPCVKVLSKALQESQEFPDEVRMMLKAILPSSLGVAHAELSPCQHKVVDLLSMAFGQMEERITGRIAEAETNSESVGSNQAEVLQKQTASEAVLQERTEAVTTKKAEAEQANAAVQTNEERLEKAAATLKNSSEQLEKTTLRLERIKAVQKDSYAPLQEGLIEPAAVTSHVDTVVALGKDLSFDESLLRSVPAVLGKPVEARAQFDLMVLQNFQEEVTKRVAVLEEDVSRCEAAKKQDADAFETTQVDCNATKSRFGELEVELAAAVAEEVKQKVDVATATAAVKGIDAAGVMAADALVSERAQLSAFREELLEKLHELRTPPPPEATPLVEVEASAPVIEAEVTAVAAKQEVSTVADDMPVDEPSAVGTSGV